MPADREYWSLQLESAAVLDGLRFLLAHPSTDISPAERHRLEADCQALASLLPPRVRGECEKPETSDVPF